MRILVSNDDGIFSPGIVALARVAREFGQVRIVAPDVEQSAMSHAITVRRPLHYTKTPVEGMEAYRVDGTPADCVALGTHHWDEVDLVLTGINLGSGQAGGVPRDKSDRVQRPLQRRATGLRPLRAACPRGHRPRER